MKFNLSSFRYRTECNFYQPIGILVASFRHIRIRRDQYHPPGELRFLVYFTCRCRFCYYWGFSCAASLTTRKKINRTTNKSGTRKNGKDVRRGLLVEVCACDPSVDNKTSSECFWICRDALVLSLFSDQTKCGNFKLSFVYDYSRIRSRV